MTCQTLPLLFEVSIRDQSLSPVFVCPSTGVRTSVEIHRLQLSRLKAAIERLLSPGQTSPMASNGFSGSSIWTGLCFGPNRRLVGRHSFIAARGWLCFIAALADAVHIDMRGSSAP